MKRSEMASKIREILEFTEQRPDFEYQILDAVEEAGMLAPFVMQTVAGEFDLDKPLIQNCKGPGFGFNLVGASKWEKE